jgi:hypothetical protein
MDILGMELREPLEEGAIPVDAVVLVKYLDRDGDIGVHLTTTESLTDFEAFGLLEIAAALQKQNIIGRWEETEDDES